MLQLMSFKKIQLLLVKKSCRLVLVAGMLVLATACTSTSTEQLVAASDKTASSAAAKDEQCIMLKLTGTNIPKKYCSSKATWIALSKKDREIAKEYTRQMNERSGIQEQSVGASPF